MEHGVKLISRRQAYPRLPVHCHFFHGALRESQQEAIDEIFKHDLGCLSAPPGFGRALIGAHLIAKRGCSTLCACPIGRVAGSSPIARLSLFLGIEPKEIGRIGIRKDKPNGILDVAMIQSLVRKDESQ